MKTIQNELKAISESESQMLHSEHHVLNGSLEEICEFINVYNTQTLNISMYGILTYIWSSLMVHVGKYT